MKKKIERYKEFAKKESINGWSDDSLNMFYVLITFIQHERSIHLIVTVSVLIVFLILCFIAILLHNVFIDAAGIVTALLLLFYIKYYCYIENETQTLYDLYYDGKNTQLQKKAKNE